MTKMTKLQSITISIILLWFSYQCTFHTTIFFVDLFSSFLSDIRRIGFFPGCLKGIFSTILVNFDQYLSMAITGLIIGLIFTDHKQSYRVLLFIYIAYIMPGILMTIIDFNQLQVNRLIYIFAKLMVYAIDYLIIYFCMIFSLKVFTKMKSLG